MQLGIISQINVFLWPGIEPAWVKITLLIDLENVICFRLRLL